MTDTMEQGEGCGEKFTPGPWRLNDDIHSHVLDVDYHAIDAGCGFYRRANGGRDGGFGLTGLMSPDDARLISAAPDLFSACKLALATAESWIHDQLDGTGMVDEALAKLEPVRAALLKASGGKDVA